MHADKPFSTDSSFKFEPIPGHGLGNRQYGGSSDEYLQSIPDDVIAPSEHYPHPYEDEIKSLKYRAWQLEVLPGDNGEHGRSGTLNNPAMSATKGVWIDNEKDLISLVDRINSGGDEMREISVDLEAHSFRSFSGFVCLMQLSLRRPIVEKGRMADLSNGYDDIDTSYDFVIDTLALRNVMNVHFAPIMANPNIVKVMHGADSDVGWLQRDFGIYIVNLFDTGRASRALPHFSRAGLAYLLSKYANVEADKKHQLSDWRQRPLPADMLAYAVSDTMYLLDIYDKIRMELIKHDKKSNDISIESVLDASKKVCLIRYDKECFKPSAYRKLTMSKRGKKKGVVLSDDQDTLLKLLYDWRDNTAREEDESVQYICGNSGLVRIASICPQTVLSLKSCMNPLPPLVLKYANDVLRLVRISSGKREHQIMDSVAKPRVDYRGSKGVLESPVLQLNLAADEEDVTSSSDVDITELSTQSANLHFVSSQPMSHSLDMKPRTSKNKRSKGVDGLGAAKAAMNEGEEGSSIKIGTVAKQNISAQKAAIKVRKALTSGNQNLLRLAKSAYFASESDEVSEEVITEGTVGQEDGEDETDEIPRSMKEIYRMSNKNRRKVIERDGDDSPPKRQRTKKDDKDEAGNNQVIVKQQLSTETGEIAYDKEQSHSTGRGIISGSHRGGNGNKSSIAPFDYSKVGAIGVSGANLGSNPFFEGVAISGGTLNTKPPKERKKQHNTPQKKQSSTQNGGLRGGKQSNYEGSNKTQVYRK